MSPSNFIFIPFCTDGNIAFITVHVLLNFLLGHAIGSRHNREIRSVQLVSRFGSTVNVFNRTISIIVSELCSREVILFGYKLVGELFAVE